jgi:adenylylsulfate kinase-like enzyme
MAGVATLVRKRRMRELGHQLRRRGLVRVVALQAVRRAKRLVLVRLLQGGIFRIVAIQAQRRSCFRQVKAVFQRRFRSGLVRDVAGVAAHVECSVTAAFFRNIHALVMAGEAEIIFLVARLAFSSWFLLSDVCGSWHFRQSRTAGG